MNWQDMESAPLDGSQFLARWTATEHGNQYMVVHWVAAENDFFCWGYPVRGMDVWCELPL